MNTLRAKERTNPERALERALNELRPVSSPAGEIMNKVYKLFKQKIGCGHSRSFLFTEDEILDDKFFDKETAEKAKSDLRQSHKDGQFYFWTFRISEEWETVKSDLYMAANL